MLNLILSFLLSTVAANDSLEFRVQSFLRAGNYKEALKTLETSKNQTPVYYRLKGQILLGMSDQQALIYLKKSISLDFNKATALLLSQAYLKNQRNLEAEEILKKIKENSIQKDLLMAQAIWQQGKKAQAVNWLVETTSHEYADYDLIERQKYFYLFKMGKIKRIFELSKLYLEDSRNSIEVGLQVISLLKEKDMYLAELFFDQVLLIRPKDPLLLRERGIFELDKGRGYLAADFFAKAAHLDKKYSFDAAAAYLSIGQHSQALFFNRNIKDTKKRLVQLFTIHLDAQRYEEALSLKYELEKYKLLDQGKVSYALAYAAFKAKDYKAFDDCFTRVTSQVYLNKILKLKEIMDSCEEEMGNRCAFS